jgi:hypothetical protein
MVCKRTTLTKRSSAAMLKRLEPMMGTIQYTLDRDVHLNSEETDGDE